MNASEARLRKTLTANDVGATGSHQAGIHVPKSLLTYFPQLDSAVLNPDCWLAVDVAGETHRWRFIHYNNAVVGAGTRDEYRLTHITSSMRRLGASRGDVLELARSGPKSYSCFLVTAKRDVGVLVLSSDGPWRLVRLGRPA